VVSASVITMPRPAAAARQIGCWSCGATTDAACDCGVAYVPAGQRAADAVAANPEKTDRAIAAEIGVDHKTVGAARKLVGEHSPPEKRVGKDGKRYKAKPAKRLKAARPFDYIDDSRANFVLQCEFSTIGAQTAMALIHDCGEIDEELFTIANNAASAWRELAEKLAPTVVKPAHAGSAVKSAADRAEARSRALELGL
jgi:hypothetical protein